MLVLVLVLVGQVSLLFLSNGAVEVLRTDGDNHLGGEDFDLKVSEWACEFVSFTSNVSVSSASLPLTSGDATHRQTYTNVRSCYCAIVLINSGSWPVAFVLRGRVRSLGQQNNRGNDDGLDEKVIHWLEERRAAGALPCLHDELVHEKAEEVCHCCASSLCACGSG